MAQAGQPAILVTRPLGGATQFADLLKPLGLPVVIAPVLQVKPVEHDHRVLAKARGMVFTSAHAVAFAGAGRGRPAVAVGAATAHAAQLAGFAVTEGPGTAHDLIPLLQGLPEGWVHPSGVHVAVDLPVRRLAVYDQCPMALSDAALDLLAAPAPVILPLFSARSAEFLAAQIKDAGDFVRAPLWIAAISSPVMAQWQAVAARIQVASTPDSSGMLAAIVSLLAMEHSR